MAFYLLELFEIFGVCHGADAVELVLLVDDDSSFTDVDAIVQNDAISNANTVARVAAVEHVVYNTYTCMAIASIARVAGIGCRETQKTKKNFIKSKLAANENEKVEFCVVCLSAGLSLFKSQKSKALLKIRFHYIV